MSPATASPRSTDPTAELRKLAHALDVEPSALDMLAGLPAADVRALRTQVGEALFQADKHYFARVATLSRTVPVSVSAKLTEAVLPPLLAARTAELLEPAKAAELVGKISPHYLARVSAHMDAARAPEVIAAIPAERVAAVGLELAAKGEWVVIGSFVSVVPHEALARSVAQFDGEQLLRIGFVLDDLSRLDDIGGLLTERQIDQLLAAAPAAGLWPELVDMLAHLSPPRIERLRERYAQAPAAVQEGYAAAVRAGDLPKKSLAQLA
jgi:hypothetical protein